MSDLLKQINEKKEADICITFNLRHLLKVNAANGWLQH